MRTAEFEKLFYARRLNELEKIEKLDVESIKEVQVMLQIITNGMEYYPEQHNALLTIDAYDRLGKLLVKNNAKELDPFEEELHNPPQFNQNEIELNAFCNNLIRTKKAQTLKNTEVLQNICDFTKWTVKDKSENYLFLLRDMFISYILVSQTKTKKCYPFLFGRKFIKYFFANKSIDGFDFDESDDEETYLKFIYIIFDAVSLYPNNFNKFFSYLKPRFLEIIKQNKSFYDYLKNYLSKITGNSILVVESGRFGTMPLILKCIDERVDFKLFSTSPEFYQIYKDKIFTKDLSKLVSLEKSICQNEMFIFSSIKNDSIMIKEVKDSKILDKCFAEINYAIELFK